jgi:hypothetical protein
MRFLWRMAVSTGVLACGLAAAPRAADVQQGEPTPGFASADAVRTAASADLFGGLWDYNAEESVNAATGRPEQLPRSATQPGGTAQRAGGGTVRLPIPRAGGGGGGTSGWGENSGRGGYAPPPQLLRENRDLSRDLLEIPEALTIRVASDRITFIDDLDRSRTYPLDGSRHRYQLAASRFNARMTWDAGQFRKEIDGGLGFKMTETYFLSRDAQRLFVIVRVAKTREDGPVIGADRVYDRITVE